MYFGEGMSKFPSGVAEGVFGVSRPFIFIRGSLYFEIIKAERES
jgi:hypothetical protein